MILLSDDEIQVIADRLYLDPTTFIRLNRGHWEDITGEVAKAQLRKAREWIEEICHDHEHGSTLVPRRRCGLCLTDLLKECE